MRPVPVAADSCVCVCVFLIIMVTQLVPGGRLDADELLSRMTQGTDASKIYTDDITGKPDCPASSVTITALRGDPYKNNIGRKVQFVCLHS